MSFGSSNKSQIDKKLEDELLVEEQKQRFHNQIHAFTDMCWEKCVDKPSNKMDGKTETCIANCVERFLDTNIFIAKRFSERFKWIVLLQVADFLDGLMDRCVHDMLDAKQKPNIIHIYRRMCTRIVPFYWSRIVIGTDYCVAFLCFFFILNRWTRLMVKTFIFLLTSNTVRKWYPYKKQYPWKFKSGIKDNFLVSGTASLLYKNYGRIIKPLCINHVSQC